LEGNKLVLDTTTKVRKNLKIFTALSSLSKDNAEDKDWLTAGFEYKF
jgi:hypothetical protein